MDTSFNSPVRPIDDCWHIYSNGTVRNTLFTSSADKVYCMNLLAVSAYLYSVRLLCAVVEDTHFHGIAKGRTGNIIRFAENIKLQLTKKYGSSKAAGEIVLSYDPIRDDQELMRKIIYVIRNPLEAGYPYLPTEYPWGVGNLFFTDRQAHHPTGRWIGDMSIRDQRRLFCTQVKLPQDWLFDESGMILPVSYIDYDYVEKELFLTPKRRHIWPMMSARPYSGTE